MMSRRGLCAVAAWLVVLVAGCGGESTGPTSGSLAITVSGLPGGTQANVGVGGPGGYTRTIEGSATLNGLPPGTYVVTASPVTSGSAVYAGEPETQLVAVSEGSVAATAQVIYSVSTGSLSVTISGLPAGTAASVQVSGPDGYGQALTTSATLTGLAPGGYTVTAGSVSASGTQYDPSPSVRQVTVGAGAAASATVAYAEAGAAGLNFRIDGMYLTQSVQTYAGAVPLVAGRDGYLRVFVTASESNAIAPDVRVRFYHGGTLVSEQTIVRAGSTPLAPQEATLASSWNLPVSKTLIQPSLSILAEVDPANLLAETNESDNLFPSSGVPAAADVRTAAPFSATLVPVITSVDGRVGGVTVGNRDQFLTTTMRMHPLSSYDALVGGSLTIGASVPALQADNANGSWNTVLHELDVRRTADNSSRYYMGIVNPNYTSGVAGIGYVGHPAALTWDKLPSAASVAAHEWGHNWGRNHAPCGGAGNPDLAFPYSGGTIGVYGFDVAAAALKPATSHDLMGYCDNEWISDYTYLGVLQYRAAEPGVAGAMGAAVQPTLVVWGRVEEGRLVLEPAFQAVTRPALPTRGGAYRVEGLAADGSRLFGLSFAPVPVADDRRDAAHFVFAVPLSPERAGRLASLTLEGAGRSTVLIRGPAAAVDVRARPAGTGGVELRWDASRSPLLIVRHPRTGEILALARGGRALVATDEPELVLSVSNRTGSRDLRTRVEGR